MTKSYGFALFGLGGIGRVHLQNLVLCGQARVLWVVEVESQLERARELVQSYGLDSVQFASVEQTDLPLSDPNVKAVIISTPTHTHEKLIHQALDADKAVMCEKPLTFDLETTAACYNKAAEKGMPLLCCFHRRFDPAFSGVQKAVREKKHGELRLLKISSHDMGPPNIGYIRNSGGIFTDSTIHDFDMALWICEARPRTVYAQGHAWSRGVGECGDKDLVTVTLALDSGVQVLIDNGRQAGFGYSQRMEALCERGALQVTDPLQTTLVSHSDEGTETAPTHPGYSTRYPDTYRRELQHFIQVLEGRTSPMVTCQDVLGAMRLAEAAAQSLKTGLPVNLSPATPLKSAARADLIIPNGVPVVAGPAEDEAISPNGVPRR